MDGFIIFLVWLLVFVAYFIVEFIINLFFTYKIKHVSDGDYKRAAITGSISTFLFMFSTLLAATATSDFINNFFFDMTILFLFWTVLAISFGNFWATMLIPKIEKILEKRRNNKKEKKKEVKV